MLQDPDHPVIEKPWEYHIVDFHYHVDRNNWTQSYIDMTLAKGTTSRRLRFWSPQRLKIEEGFPAPTHGMQVKNISHRQMEGIGVSVGDFEASRGAITFLASKVEDLDYVVA